jgi:hypothetical protein
MGERKGVYCVLVRKSEGKRPLGRPRPRWEDILDGSSGSGVWRYGLDRAGSGLVAGTCDCGNESLGSVKCGEFLD